MYIHSVCSISSLPIIRRNAPLPEFKVNEGLAAVEPNYADHIDPMQSRRMSKGLKMGLVAALDCLRQCNVTADQLQAISVGTAYGLLKDSESFLANMIAQKEVALNPTAFIQSTHNTVSGAIALHLKAHVHNMTFVQKGHSFEHALLDAELSLQHAGEQYVLLGGSDERIDVLKSLVGTQNAALGIGEAASFLLLSNNSDNAMARIISHVTFRTSDREAVSEHLMRAMVRYDLDDAVQCPTIFWNSTLARSPNYSQKIIGLSEVIGYNPTGSALALVIAAKHCQDQRGPALVVNQFKDYWSVMELA